MNSNQSAKTYFDDEVKRGDRFKFGENWREFLQCLNENMIMEAEMSLKEMLKLNDLNGKTFLDIGSGSGLFSLAARRLGANVQSFDYDPASVACAFELRKRFFPDDNGWAIEEGSAIDEEYVQSLGKYDIVYSWGVLHHTGAMWKGLANAAIPVADGGLLHIAIYNDQGIASKIWRKIKRTYCLLPGKLKYLVIAPAFVRLWGPATIRDILMGKPFDTWRNYHTRRGMSPWRDVVDWVGGYPFEVAKPEEVISFYKEKSFVLENIKTVGWRLGCNEYVFRRVQ